MIADRLCELPDVQTSVSALLSPEKTVKHEFSQATSAASVFHDFYVNLSAFILEEHWRALNLQDADVPLSDVNMRLLPATSAGSDPEEEERVTCVFSVLSPPQTHKSMNSLRNHRINTNESIMGNVVLQPCSD